MRFLELGLLWHLTWALPLFGVLLWHSWSRRATLLQRLFGASAESHLNLSKPMRLLRFALLLAALALLGVAAARPSWGVQILPSGGSGRDLLVVFDVSKSMLCKDVQPSRLEHGKWFVRQLVKRAHGDRFGLVAFAGTAFLECPLTSDKTSFLQALNELDVESIPVGGTNVQNALETALKAFKAAEGGHRAVILVTDGDELSGDSSKAIAKARETKTPLFVVGVGDPSQPQIIQAPDESGAVKTIKDASGEAVKSPLNEKALGALAVQSGGIYVRSTSANTGLEEVERRVAGLVPKDYDLGKQTRPIERFAYPLSIAFALFLIWLCLSERGMRRAAAALAFVCALSLSAEDASKAAPPVPASAASPLETFNKAVDLQSAGKDAASAAKLYEEAIDKAPADKELVSRACQNLGVIAHGQAKDALKKAVDENLKSQDLDGATKCVDSALKALAGAEDLYREGLRSPNEAAQGLKANQQTLLLDRDNAEKLKKRIEEIKKQIEQAKKDLKQSQQQQRQENQKQGQQSQQQQNQQGQGRQSQQQNQQGQGQQSQQQNQQGQGQQSQQQKQQDQQGSSAQQAAQNAKDSVDKLKDMASSLEQKRLEDSAARSSKEIEKAQQAQEKGDGKSAEKHLEEALKQLAQAADDRKGQDKKDSKDKDGGKKGEDEKQQSGDGKKDQDRKLDKPQGKGERKDSSDARDEKEIAPDQAESVLESMSNDEKSLRDAIKRNQRESYGYPRVDKDW